MAAIAKRGKPTIASKTPAYESQVPGLLAGEALAAGDIVAVRADGLVYKAIAATDQPRGVASFDASANEAVTIYRNVRFGYGAGMAEGSQVYLSGTVAGGLDTAAPGAGFTAPLGWVVDGERIQFTAF